MRTSLLSAAAIMLMFCACAGDAASPDIQPQFNGKPGKGDMTSQSAIAMHGAMGPLTLPDGGTVHASLTSKPFGNLTLKSVRLTLPDVIAVEDQGTVDAANDCGGYPLRTKVTDRWFEGVDGGWDVRGDWIGEMAIWQEKNQTQNSNIKFAGVNANGSATEIQFTARSTTAYQYQDGNATVLELRNLPLAFGAGTNRIVPTADGLPIIFCVNVTVRAEPQE